MQGCDLGAQAARGVAQARARLPQAGMGERGDEGRVSARRAGFGTKTGGP